jgi:general secretion pathway protein J
MTSRQKTRGMTLIEVLVALLLLSLLSVGMMSSFRLARHSYEQLVRVDGSRWDVVVAQRFLRGVLETAYPFDAPLGATAGHYGLEGTRERLSVTAPMPLASGSKGHYRYELVLAPRADGLHDWIVRSRIDRNGQIDSNTESTGEMGSAVLVDKKSVREEVLLARVASVQWDYLEPPALQGSSLVPPPLWRADWVGKTRLPALVRVRVQFSAGDPRLWPDLVAAPRLTASATCDFDVVRQACRELRQ